MHVYVSWSIVTVGSWRLRWSSLYLFHKAETILDIPISSALPEGSVIWNATPNIKFLVRSAYFIIFLVNKECIFILLFYSNLGLLSS